MTSDKQTRESAFCSTNGPKRKRPNPAAGKAPPPVFPDPAMNHLIQGAFHLVSFAIQKGLIKPLKGKAREKCFSTIDPPNTVH
jgi:hypothetical protein